MNATGVWTKEEAAREHMTCEGLLARLGDVFSRDLPVIDFGCGRGEYCAALASTGFDVEGIEGTPDLGELAVHDRIQVADLTTPLRLRPAQALCLEVGEHIPAEYEDALLDNLTRLTRYRLVLSWALPGQGGYGHVNCQTNEAIICKLADRGWGYNVDLTQHLRAHVSDPCWWFRNTLMVFDELETSVNTVRVVMATDDRGLVPTATALASVVRRSSLPVEARVFYRGGTPPPDVETDRLRVEVRRPHRVLEGSIPAHVTPSTFDRILAIPEFDDWERALVLDLDQLAFDDLATLCRMPFDGQLIAARRWHTTLGQAARDWFGRALPEAYADCDHYPFFFMGPLMNLDALRDAGAWERLMRFHSVARMEEQIALTVACAGRLKGIHPMWNLVPQWDALDGPSGIVHWTGPAKPWTDPPSCWRPDLWHAERTEWSELPRIFRG